MIYVIYGAAALVSFLMALNGFLSGAKTPQANAVLAFILIGLIIAAFFIAGMNSGLITLGGSFFIVQASRPLAARVALFLKHGLK